MATFVLVHGGWEAGWVWGSVEHHLRAAGHEVFRPSLTGLGERSHLLKPTVDLETHIEDVLGVIKWERLKKVTLVGHSYGGMVVTGVADRAQERIGSLIYLDAFMPKDGQSLLDLIPHERATGFLKFAEERGEGWYVPVAALANQHVKEPSEAALLKELSVPHPLATFTQKLKVSGNHFGVAKKAFVLASGYAPTPFTRFADEARALGWSVENLPTHHFPMLSMPRETAAVLMLQAM
jgi:pimeloyl-ACP methyl ester carboxylesterase